MKRFAKFFLSWISAVTLVAVTPARAQSDVVVASDSRYVVQAWRTSQGLPANVVFDIEQTPDEFLWVATSRGLARFDGVKFETFFTSRTNQRYGIRFEKLDQDRYGRLWILAEQEGLLALQAGQFVEYQTNQTALRQRIRSFSASADGWLWVMEQDGLLAKVSLNDPQIVEVTTNRFSPETRLLADRERRLWAVSDGSIHRLDHGHWVEVYHKTGATIAVGPNQAGGLWMATGGKLYWLKSDGNIQETGRFPWGQEDVRVSCLFEDDEHVLWIGTTSKGLFNFAEGRFNEIMQSPNPVICMMRDREGNRWAGTRGGGLIRLRERIFFLVNTRQGLRNPFINSLAEDNGGRMWLATADDGLGWFYGGQWRPATQADGWPGFSVLAVTPASQGGVWIATVRQGIWRGQTNGFSRLPLSSALPGGSLNYLHEAHDGRLWVGLANVGVCSISNGIVHQYGAPDGLMSQRIRTIIEDNEGHMLAGDWRGGIWRLEGSQWETVQEPTSITNEVRAMVCDATGTLWVGTDGAGIMRIKGGQVADVGCDQGLPTMSITEMLSDGDDLWCAGESGLFQVSMNDLNAVADGRRPLVTAVLHSESEGLSESQFLARQQPRTGRDRQGQLWFATANGALYFQPAAIPTNDPPPRVFIEQILVNGQVQPLNTALRLRSDARRIEFKFTAPSFSIPERVRFRHKLDGVDSDWVESDTLRSVTYGSIPFGVHVFHVSACKAAGVWGAEVATAAITIRPFFWETRWFFALIASSMVGGFFWWWRWAAIRRLRLKLELLKHRHALEQERARIAQDIHDELGANLTTIGLLSDIAKKNKLVPDAITRDLGEISETARETVGAMDAIVWAINPRNDSLDHFANYISQFTRDFFRPTTIRTRLDVPADLPNHPMSADVRHNLFLVVKESLNNVMRHAAATEVRLSLYCPNGELILTVADDGRGMPATLPGEGQDGLGNLQARLQKIGGTFQIKTQPGKGTCLEFSIPVKHLQHN